jgi:hypothetical protein
LNSEKNKTLLRTIRIPKDMDELLQRDAEAKRMSVNALISSIIGKYAEWDRYTEKYGFVSIAREGFRSILDATDEQRLEKVAKELGGRAPKEFIYFWFKKMSIDTFLAYTSLYCKYGGVAEYELETDGRNYTITAHHGLGENWSKFLMHFMTEGMKTSLGIIPKFEITESCVVMNFFVPH